MALDPDEQRRARAHLEALRFEYPELFVTDAAQAAAALAAATDDQTATARELLEDLDRLRGSLATVDERFQARQLGKIVLNPHEWGQRLTQYAWFGIQLGALFALLAPSPGYAFTSDAPRGW